MVDLGMTLWGEVSWWSLLGFKELKGANVTDFGLTISCYYFLCRTKRISALISLIMAILTRKIFIYWLVKKV